MCSPASVKILVMPTFCAMTPDRIDLTSIASSRPLQLDLDIDAGGEVELHQRVNRLRRRIDDIEQPLVGAHLELLAALLVDMRRAVHGEFLDPGRKRNRSPHFRAGTLGRVDDLLGRRIENAMVEGFEPDSYVLTLHLDDLEVGSAPLRAVRSSILYSMIDATTPAPTVRPPSRMAKRSFSSMAIGTISSTVMAMLSPGITISVPSGSCTTPVTSVVRK